MTNGTSLALIAHDRLKEHLASFVLEHRAELSRFHLVATRGTGNAIHRMTGLKVHLLGSGPRGGDRQIGELISDNEVQAVIFFRDPVAPGPHEPSLAPLLDLCDARDIPIATNRATGEALIYFLLNSPNRGVVTARPWALAGWSTGEQGEDAQERSGPANEPAHALRAGVGAIPLDGTGYLGQSPGQLPDFHRDQARGSNSPHDLRFGEIVCHN